MEGAHICPYRPSHRDVECDGSHFALFSLDRVIVRTRSMCGWGPHEGLMQRVAEGRQERLRAGTSDGALISGDELTAADNRWAVPEEPGLRIELRARHLAAPGCLR